MGVADVAAEADRQQPARQIRLDRPIDGPGDGEIAVPVGRFDQLGDDLARGLECGVQVPARAGAAEAREGELVAGVALGDVPGRIDPEHEEGNAARAGPAQGGEAVRDLFDIGAIFAAQPVDRIAHLLGALEEAAIGHHDRARRIIGEAHVEQLGDAFVGRSGFGDHAVEHRGEFGQGQLVGERERAILGAKLRGQQELPPVGIVQLADIAELGLRRRRERRSPTPPSAAAASAPTSTADRSTLRPASRRIAPARDNGCGAAGYSRAPNSPA